MKEKLTAIFSIIRPVNFLITFFSVLVAAIICLPGIFPQPIVLLAAVSAAFTLAAGNIINDINDLNVDKVNRPQRPLPSEKISTKEAYILYIFLLLISVLISLLVSFLALLIVLFSHLLLFLYSKYLKQIPLIGNITVAFLTGLVFIFGGVVVKNPTAAIIPAIFAFLINLIREIVKDMQDIEGDTKAGVTTFPVKFGYRKSMYLIMLFALILIPFTLYPFITKLYKIEYFIVVMILVNPLLVYCMKILFDNHSEKSLKKSSYLLKLSMVLGLVAIYLGV